MRMQEAREETVLFVGAHPDDIEIGCGGTIQTFRSHGFRVIGHIITTDPKRDDVIRATAELLRYEVILGGITSDRVTENLVASLVGDVIEEYTPSIVFGHSAKNDHLRHKMVSTGTDSACRGIPNFMHFCGPMRRSDFAPNLFFTFWKEEQDTKLKVLKMMREAYGPARYFTEEYLAEALWLGQRVYQYSDREYAPYLLDKEGNQRVPYVEGFEVQRLLDPFFPQYITPSESWIGGTDR